MKKKNLLFAALVLPFFLGSCSLLDDFFGDGGGYQTSEGAGGSESGSGSGSDTRIATSMSLVEHEYALEGGETYQLNLVFEPDSIMNKRVTWESSHPNIVSVSSSGKIIGLSIGTAVITVTYVANPALTDTCEVYCSSDYTVTSKTEILQDYNTYSKHSAYKEWKQGIICPTDRNSNILIIPVWFEDSSNFINYNKRETVRDDIAKAYLGTSADTGWHSVKSYYYAESFGEVELSGTVSDWYEPEDVYVDDVAIDNANVTANLINSAVDWYFNSATDSRSNYDSDGDGYIDAVITIYAAPDYQTYKRVDHVDEDDYSNLWAYQYYLGTSNNISAPNPNVFFWASYDFMYDQSTASSHAGTVYSHGDCSNGVLIDTHTLIHEMGHVFGLDDYYDYGEDIVPTPSPAGSFSMQDYNVGGHDPFSVMAYGWADPYIPVKSCSITINDFQSSHDMILLPAGEFNNKSSVFDEYLLLELYTPTGLNKLDSDYQYRGNYPQGPSTPGIRLWHVDARLAHFDSNLNFDGYTSDASNNYVVLMNNNNNSGDRISQLNSNCYWDLLQLIRDDTTVDYLTSKDLTASDLFVEGESFDFNTYSRQFCQDTFNNDEPCNWSFTVESLSSSSATITITLNQ